MEQHSETSERCESKRYNQDNTIDKNIIIVLTRYVAGEISAREAAKVLGVNTTEHDVFAGVIAANLPLPQPTAEELAIQVAALRALYPPDNWQ